MADTSFPMGGFGTLVKLVDLGDGTMAMAVSSIPATASAGTYRNITTATTTTVKSGSGIFRKLIVNTPAISSSITIYDSLTATGTKIGTITVALSLAQGCQVLEFDAVFTTGLTIVTAGVQDITVVYS